MALLVSVVMTLHGASEPAEFEPGRINALIVRDSCVVESQRARACVLGITSVMQPLAVSSEFLGAKRVLLEMGEGVADALRVAATRVSLVSEVQLMTAIHPRGPLFRETESMLASAIGARVPTAHRDLLLPLLEIALPLIHTRRVQSIGAAVPTRRCHPVGDLLRCVGAVRAWASRRDAELVLTAAELRGHARLRACLHALAAERRVVQVRHRRMILNGPDVIALLGAQS